MSDRRKYWGFVPASVPASAIAALPSEKIMAYAGAIASAFWA